MRYNALVPCLVAGLVGDWTCSTWGVHHTHYLIEAPPPLTPWLIIALLIASMSLGMTSVAFVELTHWLNARFKRFIRGTGPALRRRPGRNRPGFS